MRAPIEGLGPVGDSVASFHPLYGQGMSSAALQAVALRDTVADCGPGPELVRAMAARSARIVDNPWTIATGGDFMYPDPRGQRPKAVGWVNRYLARVMRAAAVDPMVNDAFCRVFHLLERPESLFRPAVAMRVAAHGNSRQEAQSVNQVGQVNSTG